MLEKVRVLGGYFLDEINSPFGWENALLAAPLIIAVNAHKAMMVCVSNDDAAVRKWRGALHPIEIHGDAPGNLPVLI